MKDVFIYFVCIFLLTKFTSVISFSQETKALYLNDIRILASHNSYKKKPDAKVLNFLAKVKNKIGEENNPIQLEYGHELLSTQLNDFMIRGFEFDIYYDSKGRKFDKRKINSFIFGMKKKSNAEGLKTPGFKVLHIADIDYETNYHTLEDALEELQSWSERNPMHCPIFINIEIKATSPADLSSFLRFLGFKRATKFTASTFNLLDSLVKSIFAPDQLFTPSQMKKNYSSIRERINKEGWPLLSDSRGKVFIILEGDNIDLYDNKGERPLFVYGDQADVNTLFLLRNDPIDNEIQINKLTDEYIVRTRTDAGTLEARANNYERFNAALNSNAQILSTDYYKADPAIGNFVIRIGKEFIFRKQ